jgi:hypothetical protein
MVFFVQRLALVRERAGYKAVYRQSQIVNGLICYNEFACHCEATGRFLTAKKNYD